jgi:preprotein translocase subunit YajC
MISTILLQAGSSPYQGYMMMGLIALVFYFFMIRPQIKKQKDQKKFVEELKKGDKVVTTAGIHGRIVEVTDTIVTVDVDGGVKLRFEKSAISLEASKALNAPVKS